MATRLRHPEKAHRPEAKTSKKPPWIRVRAPVSEGYARTRDIVRANRLNTVCEEAACPNVGECWSRGHATFMILGDICTRGCAFCNVATGKPEAVDHFEPSRVADAVARLGLRHVVVTSVDRDDLLDGGAEQFVRTIRSIRRKSNQTTIEILTPDFLRCPPTAVKAVVEAGPDVFNHNLETVPGLYPKIRPGAPLLRFTQTPAACQGNRSDSVHKVGNDGWTWRRPFCGAASHGRPSIPPTSIF